MIYPEVEMNGQIMFAVKYIYGGANVCISVKSKVSNVEVELQ